MKINKKIIFLIFVLTALFSLSGFFQNKTSAQIVCDPAITMICIPTGASSGLPEPVGGIEGVLKNILNWMLGIVGVIAVIGFVISGLQYITAAGSEKTIETAKRNMTYSVIGVIVALSGFVIIKAVDAALRATSTTF